VSTVVTMRYAGDRVGDDIVDSLLSTDEAKVERGRAELDSSAQPMQEVTLGLVYRAGVRLGQLAEIHDGTQGASYRAKVTSVSYRVVSGNSPSVSLTVGMVRPRVDLL
jgi:hypothetical protein